MFRQFGPYLLNVSQITAVELDVNHYLSEPYGLNVAVGGQVIRIAYDCAALAILDALDNLGLLSQDGADLSSAFLWALHALGFKYQLGGGGELQHIWHGAEQHEIWATCDADCIVLGLYQNSLPVQQTKARNFEDAMHWIERTQSEVGPASR